MFIKNNYDELLSLFVLYKPLVYLAEDRIHQLNVPNK